MEYVEVYIAGTFLALFLLWVAYIVYGAWYGEKCSHCKCRSEKWLQWHEMGKDDYRGWMWCPTCFRKSWEGFQDRAF